jgi:hypothetical protein
MTPKPFPNGRPQAAAHQHGVSEHVSCCSDLMVLHASGLRPDDRHARSCRQTYPPDAADPQRAYADILSITLIQDHGNRKSEPCTQ